jgi:hypothetical protein
MGEERQRQKKKVHVSSKHERLIVHDKDQFLTVIWGIILRDFLGRYFAPSSQALPSLECECPSLSI